ncbi:MAG: hypothetical protein OXC06_19205 [Acidimicrobiaceae bacterium]|nr:hypothetical protein [Acidimicrobiaceae bacterium]
MTADPQTLDQLGTPSLIVERSLFGDDVIDRWPVDLRHWWPPFRSELDLAGTLSNSYTDRVLGPVA